MKKLILASISSLLLSTAFATDNVGIFIQSANGPCEGDCTLNIMNAKEEATYGADNRCRPRLAVQVSDWSVLDISRNRVLVAGAFECR